jgi:hypothetical protein
MANELVLVSLLAVPVVSLFAVYMSVELIKLLKQRLVWS